MAKALEEDPRTRHCTLTYDAAGQEFVIGRRCALTPDAIQTIFENCLDKIPGLTLAVSMGTVEQLKFKLKYENPVERDFRVFSENFPLRRSESLETILPNLNLDHNIPHNDASSESGGSSYNGEDEDNDENWSEWPNNGGIGEDNSLNNPPIPPIEDPIR